MADFVIREGDVEEYVFHIYIFSGVFSFDKSRRDGKKIFAKTCSSILFRALVNLDKMLGEKKETRFKTVVAVVHLRTKRG